MSCVTLAGALIFTSRTPATVRALFAIHMLLLLLLLTPDAVLVEQATEKYQALLEYNELALEDLEERLSAVRDRSGTGCRVEFVLHVCLVPLKLSPSLPHFKFEVYSKHGVNPQGRLSAAGTAGTAFTTRGSTRRAHTGVRLGRINRCSTRQNLIACGIAACL